ncbi:PTS mannose/fructose/sorbose transporter subunit IIB [Rodentibacter caecimuris]|uniref:PTS mannose/fructose/sorbose transporter subunit IIB n=2 Tax=Rodentibacter TaxID=1960084 RepID=A0A1V3IHH7_9PAST|nr:MULTISPECIES: PTS sugar transporter subunit IIB [Rodentibacter]AOF52925.1 PTS system, mannose-specific IIB component [Pasteurellaceae bacterium NI1060]MBF0752256.1 PTS sugar transporter subunit IIB [Pasteurella sp. 19428wF3_WM03]TFU50255.1 PTS mannose/fructose/sorbose transporter subunit IIB [Pasteurella sp. WM03]MCQ9123639.1 PTS sugar transporter subunit IIB [Rodentibacter heylii]OOF40574.1 PTS mannose/fructose/sorbose transporter subunit IIB [Rodentibacter mrazii]
MICFSRIDDRLIHGQVVTTWVNLFKVEQIVVLNDKLAIDQTQKNILTMAAPQGIKVVVLTIEKFAEIYQTKGLSRRTMLLFTNSIDVLSTVNAGVPINELNVGGMRFQEGRTQLTKALSVTNEERSAFQQLLDKEVTVTIQMVPNDEKINLTEVIK